MAEKKRGNEGVSEQEREVEREEGSHSESGFVR